MPEVLDGRHDSAWVSVSGRRQRQWLGLVLLCHGVGDAGSGQKSVGVRSARCSGAAESLCQRAPYSRGAQGVRLGFKRWQELDCGRENGTPGPLTLRVKGCRAAKPDARPRASLIEID